MLHKNSGSKNLGIHKPGTSPSSPIHPLHVHFLNLGGDGDFDLDTGLDVDDDLLDDLGRRVQATKNID